MGGRRVRAALATAVLALVAAGCAAPASPSEPVALRVVMADDWATAPAVADVVAGFEHDHPEVRVELEGAPFSRIPELVTEAIDLDQPPDLAHWHAFAAAAAGLAEPLDEQWDANGLTEREYLAGAVDGVLWEGRRYGLPLDVNALVLLVNRPLLEEAGAGPAQLATVDGFRAAARQVVREGAADHAVPVSASSWVAYGWIVAHGGELVVVEPGTGKPRFTFDHPATVEAVALLAELVEEGLAPPPFAPDLAMDAVQSFAQGRVAMHTTGSWDLPITRRFASGGVDVDDDVAVLPLPQRDPARPRTVLGGSSLFVPRGAAHAELAVELALRLTEDEVALRLATEEGRLPARAHLYDADLFRSSPQVAAFVDQLPHAEVMPLIAWPPVAEGFREALEAVLSGRRPADVALGELQRFAEEVAGS
jgi:multiple sugar transport system substrate-binding protein